LQSGQRNLKTGDPPTLWTAIPSVSRVTRLHGSFSAVVGTLLYPDIKFQLDLSILDDGITVEIVILHTDIMHIPANALNTLIPKLGQRDACIAYNTSL